jgi:23S rRNA-/tRNA-specific pseudouridylate synthase
LAKKEGEIKMPVERQEALTKYRVIKEKKDFSVVTALPFTGRTNQIRIHFKQIGHPVVGESKFAFRKDFQLKAKRLCLHAASLEFIHPESKKIISLQAPLPKEMQDFLDKH